MKQLIMIFGLLGFTLLAGAADDSAESMSPVTLNGRGYDLSFPLPTAWKMQRKPLPELAEAPLKLRLQSNRPHGLVILLTVFKDLSTQQMSLSERQLIAAVRDIAAPFAKHSVEREISVRQLGRQTGQAAYAAFTDSRHQGEEAKPEDYRHISSGIIRHLDLTIQFTVLSHSLSSDDYKKALLVLERLGKKSADPAK